MSLIDIHWQMKVVHDGKLEKLSMKLRNNAWESHGLQPMVSQTATYKAHWNHLDKLNEKNCHVSQQKLGDKTSISHKHLEATIAELGY
jgi:hypothetical protein